MVINQQHFGSPGLLEYWSNDHTIAPNMVSIDMNFALTQSRGCTIIIIGVNTFQRLRIFPDLNDTEQESVQNE